MAKQNVQWGTIIPRVDNIISSLKNSEAVKRSDIKGIREFTSQIKSKDLVTVQTLHEVDSLVKTISKNATLDDVEYLKSVIQAVQEITDISTAENLTPLHESDVVSIGNDTYGLREQ